MDRSYTYIADLAGSIPEVPEDSILSRTIFESEQIKVMLFGFAAGEELSEHTASMPAILHFLEGEADLTLGDDRMEAGPGTWVHMPAHLSHSIQAKTAVVMMLMLIKSG
ncbi:MAG TPA: cupin domain-containing protein [Chloroflexi bacterium]|nr:cupin domain-containing protein [Chloroflexota bacterium]